MVHKPLIRPESWILGVTPPPEFETPGCIFHFPCPTDRRWSPSAFPLCPKGSCVGSLVTCKEQVLNSQWAWLFPVPQKLENSEGALTENAQVTLFDCYSDKQRYTEPVLNDWGRSIFLTGSSAVCLNININKYINIYMCVHLSSGAKGSDKSQSWEYITPWFNIQW